MAIIKKCHLDNCIHNVKTRPYCRFAKCQQIEGNVMIFRSVHRVEINDLYKFIGNPTLSQNRSVR